MIREAGKVRIRRAILLLIYFTAACLCRCHSPLVLLTDKGYADLLLPCINSTTPKISEVLTEKLLVRFCPYPHVFFTRCLRSLPYTTGIWQRVGGHDTIAFTILGDLITWH